MSSHSRQRFRCTKSNVESVPTELSAAPGQMSSQSRQRFPLHEAQCRDNLDSAFHSTRPNVKSFLTALPLYQVQCRVSPDSAFRCATHNVESVTTALSTVPGPMSSHSRKRFALYHVQWRVSHDSAFRCTKTNVELKSTRYCTLLYAGFLIPALEL